MVSKKATAILVIFAFTLGIMLSSAFKTPVLANEDTPIKDSPTTEKNSPGNWILEEDIKVYEDRVIIKTNNARWAKFTDTNSMDPVFDVGNNAIQTVPKDPKDLQEGDIISYVQNEEENLIIHRIIEINEDEKGWYAYAKGDNNTLRDPQKIRFDQIKKVVIAIIY